MSLRPKVRKRRKIPQVCQICSMFPICRWAKLKVAIYLEILNHNTSLRQEKPTLNDTNCINKGRLNGAGDLGSNTPKGTRSLTLPAPVSLCDAASPTHHRQKEEQAKPIPLFGAGDLGSNTPRALGRLCSQRPYRFAMRLLPPITDKKRNGPSPFLFLVPVTGVEPVRCCHLGILSPVRLPIPPHRLTT